VPANDASAELSEYEAIMASSYFAGQTNSSRFLKFVCDKYFAGVQHVTEVEIAVEALGRRPDFDPHEDSIVRVEAHRVRKRLHDFYENGGGKHSLRMDLPQGSYVPTFVPVRQPQASAASDGLQVIPHGDRSALTPQLRQWFHPWYRAALLCLLIATVIAAGFAPYFRKHARQQVPAASAATPPLAAEAEPSEVLIMAGSSAKNYTDQLGHVWSEDRYFDGGERWNVRYRRIARTDDPQIFLSARQGQDFSYNIPLMAGHYELQLSFAETFYGADNSEGGGESSRMFDITANGAPLLLNFDPLSDAGGSNIADVRVFTGISPAADGNLHLRFWNHFVLKGVAFVNAIYLIRTEEKAMPPIRWVAGNSAVEDHLGQLWIPDQYVLGGRRRELREEVTSTSDPALFKSERYGNFSYAIPVADNGAYTLTLHFAEHWFGVPNYGGGGDATGRRIFDVYCNGIYLLKDFDIYKEAGGSLKALTKTFHGLKPDHQGKLLISFVPNHDYPNLTALEVVPEQQ
jgi:hypothetical protein